MPNPIDYAEKPTAGRTLVLHPRLLNQPNTRSPEQRLEEAVGLAHAINLEIVDAKIIPLKTITPATCIGSGKVEEISHFIKSEKIALTIVDANLSPKQQSNLEKATKCKVIDRTALILEIFGARAQTKEGALQVELAALDYQKSRLVRSWTHLERQRGGFGFLGGPGETQIELDRRKISDRMAGIRRELEKVKKMRALHRKSRQDVPYPVVALVGYTNAGKSTLFNRLTGADVLVKDMLFATLDPTMRSITLPSKRQIILSDTVGFISDLPTQLVAAFRATLEEVTQAEIILHVRDIASEDSDAQKDDVLTVLSELGLEDKMRDQMIEVQNKIDLAPDKSSRGTIGISALTGEGCDALLQTIDNKLASAYQPFEITIDSSNGKLLAWLYAHGKNVTTTAKDDKMHISLMLSPKDRAKLEKLHY